MNKSVKELLQYCSALFMLASGVVLAFLCFFLNNYIIDDSILWYIAQTLVYAGSIFGVSVYIAGKFGEIKHLISNKDENK